MTRITAAILVLTMSACGLTMTTGPDPNRPPMERPRCTETYAASKRDAIGAVVGLVSVLFGAIAFEYDNDTVGVPLLVGGLVVTAGAYVSGGIGYYRVKRCKKAFRAYQAELGSTRKVL